MKAGDEKKKAEACEQCDIASGKEKPKKRKGWWGRYLDRLEKATGGRPPKCCS